MEEFERREKELNETIAKAVWCFDCGTPAIMDCFRRGHETEHFGSYVIKKLSRGLAERIRNLEVELGLRNP